MNKPYTVSLHSSLRYFADPGNLEKTEAVGTNGFVDRNTSARSRSEGRL
jgi:hypothetical protein